MAAVELGLRRLQWRHHSGDDARRPLLDLFAPQPRPHTGEHAQWK